VRRELDSDLIIDFGRKKGTLSYSRVQMIAAGPLYGGKIHHFMVNTLNIERIL